MLASLKALKLKLISQGQLSKYLLYAAGEMFIVVVGILLALQVNNFNIRKQQATTERQYYQRIESELLQDRQLLNDEYKHLNDRLASYARGIEIINSSDTDALDELARPIFRLLEYGDFRRKSSTYQTLVSSGEIIYIKNKNVVNGLQEIERAYQIIERLEEIQANLVMSHTASAVNEIMDFQTERIVDPSNVFSSSFGNRFHIANRLAIEKKVVFELALKLIEDLLVEIADSS
jgi:hypothetical protein